MCAILQGMTLLGNALRGLVAAAVGTLAMDLVLYRRARRSGTTQPFGSWEFSEGLNRWEDAPAPAHVGKRAFEALSGRPLPPTKARLTNNVMHWFYGIQWGGGYGLLAGLSSRSGPLWGLPFGTAVWASGYVVLPLMGLYKPMWKYPLPVLLRDWSAHAAYGLTTASAFQVLTRDR